MRRAGVLRAHHGFKFGGSAADLLLRLRVVLARRVEALHHRQPDPVEERTINSVASDNTRDLDDILVAEDAGVQVRQEEVA